MDTETLTKQIEDVDKLVEANVITKEKGKEWKTRLIADFDKKEVPALPPRELPNDFAHFPGRMVASGINLLGKIAERSGNRIAEIDQQNKTTEKKKEGKTFLDVCNDSLK